MPTPARWALIAVAAAFVYYVGEDLWVYHRKAYGSVEVQVYDAVPMKGQKVQFYAEEPQALDCVRALLPHAGLPPCWYLRRHRSRRVDE